MSIIIWRLTRWFLLMTWKYSQVIVFINNISQKNCCAFSFINNMTNMCVFQATTTTSSAATFPLFFSSMYTIFVKKRKERKFIAMHSIRNQTTAVHITSTVAFDRLIVSDVLFIFILLVVKKNSLVRVKWEECLESLRN